ncbi:MULTISPECIES: hypothetical protein [Myxococcus]|uniref:hypothetical protein n=1 Tax=Myxococcus TaxID=32 RepID=UPI0002DA342B|nr:MULTISPECIES: hypothetical protein [Myxococcus]QVW70480.1 hypothetical protein JTM82_13385 [Myxococcus xanthus DZ2]QZZ49353.1 hypothetical protein MyxoNM_09090 [Myxococcus xanthus]UEO03392.1 hypothetical protein K1515_29430 [Myxococcus xanthus DZ2]UYI16437.1 hypothetical protein N3T43_09010 [Myxococcus xanthus]UYI23799.1 hypothetical protein N1129_09010 [Myxococcus xanthus]
MKVKQLISILAKLDADANVYVMMQQHLPFECVLAGVAVRGDFTAEGMQHNEGPRPGEVTASNDVFLLEGEQLRRGDKAAWKAPRRA